MVFTLLIGALIWLPARRARRELRTRDGFFVVTLMWAGMSAFAAIPFMLTPQLNASYTDAYFEAMSGLTTTGASAFSGLDLLPKSLLYYRQQMQWLGGMGIIVLAVAILPMLGIGGMQLFKGGIQRRQQGQQADAAHQGNCQGTVDDLRHADGAGLLRVSMGGQ
jgi:trk system potassium uptake protein TrkH